MRHLINSIFLTTILLFSLNLCAAEDEESEVKEDIMYYQVTPNIMTFYQNSSRKMGYIVVQVQVVVRGQENFDLIDYNLPLVQDTLVDFFNRQQKSTIEDLKQRESLRSQAKDRVTAVLKDETGKNIVENLLFTQYVFQ